MKALGRQILAEYYNCDKTILNSSELIRKCMEEAAIETKCTIVKSVFHMFSPHGISGVVVIAESHFAIHTWPEYDYAAVDIFTCGETVDPRIAYDLIKKKLKASYSTCMEIKRGKLDLRKQELLFKPKIKEQNLVSVNE